MQKIEEFFMNLAGLSFNNFEKIFFDFLEKSTKTPFKSSLQRGELEEVVKHVLNTNQYLVPSTSVFPDLPPCKVSPITFENMSGVNAKIGSLCNSLSLNRLGMMNFLAESSVRIAQNNPIVLQRFGSCEVAFFGEMVAFIETKELSHDELRQRVATLKNDPKISPEMKALLEKGKYCSMTEEEYKEIANLAAMIASVFLMAVSDMEKNKGELKKEEAAQVSLAQKDKTAPRPVDATQCLYAVTVAAFIGSVFKSMRQGQKTLEKSIEAEREEVKRNAEEAEKIAEKNYMIIMKDVLNKLLKASYVKEENLKKEIE